MGGAPAYCTQCGQPLSTDARFCLRCGHPVAGTTVPVVDPRAGFRPEGGLSAPVAPARPRSFWRSPLGIILTVAVVIVVVVLVVLATIPVGHTVHYSTLVSSSSGPFHVDFGWTWTFPSGRNVTVTWSGPVGTITYLTVFGGLGMLLNQSGTSGTFWFMASALPYVFQATVNGTGLVQGTLDVSASYQSPIL